MSLHIHIGQSITLQAQHPSNYGPGGSVHESVDWEVDDEAVATYTVGGGAMNAGSATSTVTVTGVSAGDCTVTATSGSGETATFQITVDESGGPIAIVPIHAPRTP